MNVSEPIHLHTNRLNRNYNIFLFFVPAVVFILVLAAIFLNYQGSAHTEIAVESSKPTVVLGEDAVLDKAKVTPQNQY